MKINLGLAGVGLACIGAAVLLDALRAAFPLLVVVALVGAALYLVLNRGRIL